MTVFDPPIFIKPSHPQGDVIVFGKSPEFELLDAANGVARFGGTWRAPSYFRAYLRAASVLVAHGKGANSLDDFGLPAFYLQRHALELLIKRLLSWVYEYADAIGGEALPTKKQKDRFKHSHGLSALLDDLESTCRQYDFSLPPKEFYELVKEFKDIEITETWSRYDRSETNPQVVVQHMKDEVVVPIVALQEKLEAVVANVAFRFDGTAAYENELYEAWSDVVLKKGT